MTHWLSTVVSEEFLCDPDFFIALQKDDNINQMYERRLPFDCLQYNVRCTS